MDHNKGEKEMKTGEKEMKTKEQIHRAHVPPLGCETAYLLSNRRELPASFFLPLHYHPGSEGFLVVVCKLQDRCILSDHAIPAANMRPRQ